MRSITIVFVIGLIGLLFSGNIKAEQVALPIVIMDALENDWIIQKNGRLNGPYPYMGGSYASQISIDGTMFPEIESATRNVYENGIEIVLGPRAVGSIQVTRKIYLGEGEGHVRYLEILNNTTTTPVSVKVELLSHCSYGDGFIHVWDNENSAVVEFNKQAGVEFICGQGGSLSPKRDKRSTKFLRHTWEAVSILPQSKVTILHFVAVRPKREQALEFAQSFEVAPACSNIDPVDLTCIINYDPSTLGARSGIEIFRGTQERDVVQLKSGDQFTGIVQNEKIEIQASYARLVFPTEQIGTVIFEGGASNIERIIVLNEDVFSGFIQTPKVDMKLDAGGRLVSIRKEKISKLGFRVRPGEREKYPVKHDITLTNGDHFSGTVKNKSLTIAASFGDMPVDIDQIAKIEFISRKGTVTEITLKNGDKVSGFLKDEDIEIDLDFGEEVNVGGGVKIYQDRLEKIVFDSDAVSRITGEQVRRQEQENNSQ